MPTKRIFICTAAAVLLAGCGSSADPGAGAEPSGLGHVHGIGLNPADQTVYVASHTGVYRLAEGKVRLIANRHQDTMGFTIAGPDEFLASGHPGPGDDTPNPLGLIQSGDRAATWKILAFGGEQDLHSIDAAGGRTYAYASEGRLLASKDRKTWTSILEVPLIDIAANPRSPDEVVATTQTGELIVVVAGQEPARVKAAPPMALVDRTGSGDIVGVDPSGTVFASDDNGVTWQKRAPLDGQPEAISVRADTWYAATTDGIFASSDQGASWRRLLKLQM